MTFHGIEFGIAKSNTFRLKDYFEFSLVHTNCDCIIFSFSIFYVTLLSKECYSFIESSQEGETDGN